MLIRPTRQLWTQALLLLAVSAASAWHPAHALEFRCSNGAQERRVEVSGPYVAEDRACEVRYWRDAQVPDSGRVLWYARQDADFCAPRARGLIRQLEAGGWTCVADEEAAGPESDATEEAAVPPTDAAAPSAAPGEHDPPTRALQAPAEAAPTEAAEPAPAHQDEEPTTGPGEPGTAAPVRAASEPSGVAPRASAVAAAAPEQPTPPAPTPAEAAEPEPRLVPPSAHAAAAQLDQVVRETLASVEQLYGGDFRAEAAKFGDLDGDGMEDAAVLITYEAADDEYVQYLVAYLFNGETFQSVATRNVGGRFLEARRADLEGIADQRIVVELEVPDANDACCATRRDAFALERGELVEVSGPEGAVEEATDGKPAPSG